MWKVLCLLGVLAGPVKSYHLTRRDIRGLNDRGSQGTFEKVHYSYSVPIWQYSPGDEFICKQPGYFPDPHSCQYFHKCTFGQPDHLFQFIYRCENGRVYSPKTNRCVRPADNDLICSGTSEDESSMEIEDEQAEPNQQTSGAITVKKPSSQNDLTNEGVQKETQAENLAVQSDGRAVNAPTEKPVSSFSIRTPDRIPSFQGIKNTGVKLLKGQLFDDGKKDEDIVPVNNRPQDSIRLPKIQLNVSVEKKVPSFQGIRNTGVKLLKGQLFDDGKQDEDIVPVNNRPQDSIRLPKIQLNVSVEKKVPSFQGIRNTGVKLLKGQLFDDGKQDEDIVPVNNRPPSIPERQATLPPIPEMESDEKNEEEVSITVTPISAPALPSISETEELKELTDNTQKVADQSERYDKENSSDCIDEGFYGIPGQCSKFYMCVSSGSRFVRYEVQCPSGTIWDDSLKTCNFRAAIKGITCQDKSLATTPAPPTSTTAAASTTATASTTPPASSDDSDTNRCPFGDIPDDRIGIVCPTGFRQHPSYCNMFYQCISSDNFELNFTSLVCPDDMVFNMERLRCEIDETRGQSCNMFEPIEKQDDGQILIHTNLELCPEEGRFIYGERCSNRYIECLRDENGKLEGYLLTCPPGQMYSRGRDKCRSSSHFPHCPLLI